MWWFGTSPCRAAPEDLPPSLAQHRIRRTIFYIGSSLNVRGTLVIDEFPNILPFSKAETTRVLTQIAAVMEEEQGGSSLKLILCGSSVGQMEALQSEKNPLHGRLTPLVLRPLGFDKARLFVESLPPLERFERFAIAGGMPRYLSVLGKGSLRTTVCRLVLDQNGPLWNEVRTVIAQELREPNVYFSMLQGLAGGDKEVGELARIIRSDSNGVTPYLAILRELGLVSRRLPAGAASESRQGRWRLDDPFFRFWFRYVFPFQDDLESGLSAEDLFEATVSPTLAEHVSPVFEEWCRDWTRAQYGTTAQRVSSWWGNARNELRATGERSSEEVDVVGLKGSKVAVVGEAKWTNRRMGAQIVSDLDNYKLPAMRQSGLRFEDDLKILLFSRSGYSPRLVDLAASDDRIELVDVVGALAGPPPALSSED